MQSAREMTAPHSRLCVPLLGFSSLVLVKARVLGKGVEDATALPRWELPKRPGVMREGLEGSTGVKALLLSEAPAAAFLSGFRASWVWVVGIPLDPRGAVFGKGPP